MVIFKQGIFISEQRWVSLYGYNFWQLLPYCTVAPVVNYALYITVYLF